MGRCWAGDAIYWAGVGLANSLMGLTTLGGTCWAGILLGPSLWAFAGVGPRGLFWCACSCLCSELRFMYMAVLK